MFGRGKNAAVLTRERILWPLRSPRAAYIPLLHSFLFIPVTFNLKRPIRHVFLLSAAETRSTVDHFLRSRFISLLLHNVSFFFQCFLKKSSRRNENILNIIFSLKASQVWS